MYNKLNKEQEKEIIELKRLKTPLNIIREKFNIKRDKTIYDVIKRDGRDHIVGNKKYIVDENFFNIIDTEEKSYWLGFLYADGYVRLNKGRSGELKLKLKKSDRKHIELLNKHLKSNYLIKNDISKLKVKDKIYESKVSYVAIYNTKIVKDLINQGCGNKKTFKIRLPKLDDDLMKHFIRGYFDGDGSISNTKIRKCHYCINIASNDVFALELSNYLNDKFKISNKLKKQGKISIITITNRKNNVKFYNALYKDSKVYLDRKKIIFDEMIKNFEENPIKSNHFSVK